MGDMKSVKWLEF